MFEIILTVACIFLAKLGISYHDPLTIIVSILVGTFFGIFTITNLIEHTYGRK